jgi:hypothetical protein
VLRVRSQGPKSNTAGVKSETGRRGDRRWDAAATVSVRRQARTQEKHLTDTRQASAKWPDKHLEALKPSAEQPRSSEERFVRIESSDSHCERLSQRTRKGFSNFKGESSCLQARVPEEKVPRGHLVKWLRRTFS